MGVLPGEREQPDGRTIAGTPTEGGGVAGTAAVKAFGVEAARTGPVDDAAAREAGFDPLTGTIEAKSRAGYYSASAGLTVTSSMRVPSTAATSKLCPSTVTWSATSGSRPSRSSTSPPTVP